MHLSTLGVDSDYKDVLTWCLRMGILDGYFGLYAATMLEDEHFGKPKVRRGTLNLAVLDPSKTNIAIHGHEPMLAESMVRVASRYPEVNLVGVCCTGATLLAKHGIPHAAHFILQENVVATGIVEALVVDVQCVMPSVQDFCECFHTKLITTNPIGRMSGALHMPIGSRDSS